MFLYILAIDRSSKMDLEIFKKVVLDRESFLKEAIAPKGAVYPVALNYERKDWHDWAFIKYENNRQGPGENV